MKSFRLCLKNTKKEEEVWIDWHDFISVVQCSVTNISISIDLKMLIELKKNFFSLLFLIHVSTHFFFKHYQNAIFETNKWPSLYIWISIHSIYTHTDTHTPLYEYWMEWNVHSNDFIFAFSHFFFIKKKNVSNVPYNVWKIRHFSLQTITNTH